MRILILTQYFWPETFRINDLALALQERGHEVSVLTGIPNYPDGVPYPGYHAWWPRREVYAGIPVARVPLVTRDRGQSWRLVLNFLSFAASASLLGPWLAPGGWDVVFVFQPSPVTVGLPALWLKFLKRAPVALWIQDPWPESLTAGGAHIPGPLLGLVRSLVRRIYRGCDLILLQSAAYRASVVAAGAPPERLQYLPNWAEDLFRPLEAAPDAAERALLPAGFVVVFAGNIGMSQDFETILAGAEKLRHLDDVHWVILGDGRRRAWAEAEAAERGLVNVHFLGRHPIERMPRFFALADALLVTLGRGPVASLTVPSKLQPYLACARPVIAALDGEGARVVDEAGAGVTCRPASPDDLARAVCALRDMPETERRAMGLRGRAYYEVHFAKDRLVAQLEGWLRNLGGQEFDLGSRTQKRAHTRS